jgi:hypothetical protein
MKQSEMAVEVWRDEDAGDKNRQRNEPITDSLHRQTHIEAFGGRSE